MANTSIISPVIAMKNNFNLVSVEPFIHNQEERARASKRRRYSPIYWDFSRAILKHLYEFPITLANGNSFFDSVVDVKLPLATNYAIFIMHKRFWWESLVGAPSFLPIKLLPRRLLFKYSLILEFFPLWIISYLKKSFFYNSLFYVDRWHIFFTRRFFLVTFYWTQPQPCVLAIDFLAAQLSKLLFTSTSSIFDFTRYEKVKTPSWFFIKARPFMKNQLNFKGGLSLSRIFYGYRFFMGMKKLVYAAQSRNISITPLHVLTSFNTYKYKIPYFVSS